MASFNGATAMKPWKSMDDTEKPKRPGKLQWGHGDEAVEEPAAARFFPPK